MKISLKKEKGSKIILEGELSPLEFEKFYEEAKEKIKKDIQLKGFRKGKVPKEILETQEEKIEKDILREASSLAIRDVYLKTLEREKLEPIGEPLAQIEKLAKGESFIFHLTFYIIPQISLPNYREIAKEIKREKIEVEDKEIQETLDWLKKSRPKLIPTEKEAGEGDFIEIEYSSPQIEGGKIFQDRFILGKGGFAGDFEKEIMGMKKGEKKKIKISFPPDYYDKRVAGKEAETEVTLKEVFQTQTPELNDEFARSLGKFNSLEDLRKSIKEGIFLEKTEEENRRLLEEFLQKIIEKTSFDIPELLLKVEEERLLKNVREGIKKDLNLEFDDYLKRINKTSEEFSQSLSQIAENNVRRWLVMREIAQSEQIDVSEEEVEEKVNEFLKNYEDVERARREIDLERLRNYTKEEVRNQKVLEFLLGLIP